MREPIQPRSRWEQRRRWRRRKRVEVPLLRDRREGERREGSIVIVMMKGRTRMRTPSRRHVRTKTGFGRCV
jgi:hypothetical protein